MTVPLTHQVKLEHMDLSLSSLRIVRPRDLDKMQESLHRSGQLNPVIVRKHEALFQVLDGFKRWHSAERLGWECLQAMVLDVPIARGKALMLSYNRVTRSLFDYDEALVVHSLSKEYIMDQAGISRLTGYSRSWVCRRLALIDKLSAGVRDQFRMGVISNSHARSVVKLPL